MPPGAMAFMVTGDLDFIGKRSSKAERSGLLLPAAALVKLLAAVCPPNMDGPELIPDQLAPELIPEGAAAFDPQPELKLWLLFMELEGAA